MTEIREIGEDELERLCTVLNTVSPDEPAAPAEMVDWRSQAEAMAWWLTSDGERDVAGGYALTGWHSPPRVGRAWVGVLPGSRGAGLGSELLAQAGLWLAERGCDELTGPVHELDDESREWLERRGFVENGRDSRLVLELASVDVPAVDPPAGIEVVTWGGRPELIEGLYRVMCEASPDVPGEDDTELPSLESWLANDLGGASDHPEAVFVALEDGKVVGFAKLSFMRGEDIAYHDLTGVLRSERCRGIAGALKRRQIGWAKEAGFRELRTANEERNEPIRRLNQRHGYRVQPGSITMRGRVG